MDDGSDSEEEDIVLNEEILMTLFDEAPQEINNNATNEEFDDDELAQMLQEGYEAAGGLLQNRVVFILTITYLQIIIIYNNYVLYAITNVTTVMYCIVIVSHDCYMFSYRCTLLLCIQYVYTRF